MALSSVQTADRAVQQNLSFLQFLLADCHSARFRHPLLGRQLLGAGAGQPARYTLVLNHPGALRAMFWPPNGLTLGEAYIYDDIDIEGDLEPFWQIGIHLRDQAVEPWEKLRFVTRVLALAVQRRPRTGGPGRSEAAGLTPFPGAGPAGRHLPLQRLQRLLRPVAGPAHGLHLRLFRHAGGQHRHGPGAEARPRLPQAALCARASGCSTSAAAGARWRSTPPATTACEVLGVTLSQPQVELANAAHPPGRPGRPLSRGMPRLPRRPGRPGFDKIAAIGILEHVGEAKLLAYFRKAWDLLKPGGVFLSHGIASQPQPAAAEGPDLLRPLRLPRRRTDADQQEPGLRRAGRLRGPRRGEPARALPADAAALGAPPGGTRRRGAPPDRRRDLPHLAAVPGDLGPGFPPGSVNLYQALLLKPHA